jgi:hypothetical protein
MKNMEYQYIGHYRRYSKRQRSVTHAVIGTVAGGYNQTACGIFYNVSLDHTLAEVTCKKCLRVLKKMKSVQVNKLEEEPTVLIFIEEDDGVIYEASERELELRLKNTDDGNCLMTRVFKVQKYKEYKVLSQFALEEMK